MSDHSSQCRIVFVPGLRPKPAPEHYRSALLRCIRHGLARTAPDALALIDAADFRIYAWNYDHYGLHRDPGLDAAGITRLLSVAEPTARQLAQIEAMQRRAARWTRRVADQLPLLGRLFVSDRVDALLVDARRYLLDSDGTGTRMRRALCALLQQSRRDDERLIVIGHSFGSVIAYDTLWELSHHTDLKIDLFMTLGSPLATRFVRRHLRGTGYPLEERYPHNIRRWANYSARGELTSLYPRLAGHFDIMLQHGWLESFEDHDGIYTHYEDAGGLNVHEVYGYLVHRNFARRLADTLRER